jgi:hypothetical protein
MEGANKNVQLFSAVAGGLVAGCLLGYFVARRQTAASAERRIQEETDSVREHYARRTEQLQAAHAVALANATSKGSNPIDGPAPVGEGVVGGGAVGSPSRPANAPPLTDYQRGRAAADQGPGEPDDAGDVPAWNAGVTPLDQSGPDGTGRQDPLEGLSGEDPDDEEWPEVENIEDAPTGLVVDQTKPYLITAEEFGENAGGYEQISLTYYMGDNALIDSGEIPMRNPSALLGDTFSAQFGANPGDPRVIHIRNRRLGVDFEVALHDGKYVEEVLHYGKPE